MAVYFPLSAHIEMLFLHDIFYIPRLGMYIPSLGMYVPNLGIYIPSLGI